MHAFCMNAWQIGLRPYCDINSRAAAPDAFEFVGEPTGELSGVSPAFCTTAGFPLPDGIGWCFCQQLAQKRFNIILISRTASKLKDRASELEQKYNVKTHIIAADFTQCLSDPDFFARIYSELNTSTLDIGILVNNVGGSFKGGAVQLSEEDWDRQMDFNL